MPQLPIVAIGESAAVILPLDVLKSVGLKIGDSVEVTSSDQQLILRPVEDSARQQLLDRITEEVFEHRRDAYQRLA